MVPAPRYPISVQALTTAAPISARCLALMPGAGASSMTFLVTPLYGTVPLPEMDAMAVGIAEHLEFNMTGSFQKFFHVQSRIAESLAGFRPSGWRIDQARPGMDDPHAASATATGSQRITG